STPSARHSALASRGLTTYALNAAGSVRASYRPPLEAPDCRSSESSNHPFVGGHPPSFDKWQLRRLGVWLNDRATTPCAMGTQSMDQLLVCLSSSHSVSTCCFRARALTLISAKCGSFHLCMQQSLKWVDCWPA